jgi:tRNA (mo5U34)-methyltransferase
MNKIDSIKFWYHHIDLGNGVTTPGCHPVDETAYRVPDDLTGKRVLDVGSWDGYWAFEALKRGASEVVAIDDWSDMPWLEKNKRTPWDTFDICKEALGYGDECKRITMSLYDVKKLGQFDVVFFFGALYHCRYPLLALDRLSAVCKETIYIETAICNDYSPYRKTIGAAYNNDLDVLMEFYPTTELGNVGTNWWSPTLVCLQSMVNAAGFRTVEAWKVNKPDSVCVCRGFAKGTKA